MAQNITFGKSNDIYGFQTLYREIGYYINRLEQYERSLKFFDEAIRKTPDDKRALIGRSIARAKAIQYEGALEDINKALGLDPDDLRALAEKALNTYLCCEFEEGLVQNSRLTPIRQKPENFVHGVMHCKDAIENCVGERTGRPLRDHFRIIRRLAWKKNYAAQKPFVPKPRLVKKNKNLSRLKKLVQSEGLQEPVQPKKQKLKQQKEANADGNELHIRDSLHSKKSDDEPIPPFSDPFPYKPLQNYTSNIENYMAEKYLDSMYLDKIFLKKFATEPGTICPNEKGSKKIKQIAKSCYKTVSYKQELLRTRRPFYFIKYHEANISQALKQRQAKELEHHQRLTKTEADVIKDKMLDAYQKKNLKVFLEIVDKLKRFCDQKPKRLLPNKDDYMRQIYDKVCKAFYEVYRVNEDANFIEQSRRLYALMGLPLSRDPSTDSVIANFRHVYLDYRKLIREYEQRLINAVLSEEICWFYHELSRYNLELKKYELARVYARKCIQEAKTMPKHATEDNNNLRWILNATMIMTKCHLQQHNKNDAKNSMLDALACAKQLQDKSMVEFVHTCQDVVDGIEFDDIYGPKELRKREETIVKLMAEPDMKDEAAYLFRQMSAMPCSRRMTVIPGITLADDKTKSTKSRAMSIMPESRSQPKLSLPAPLKKGEDKGSEFMNLVEFHVQ